MPGSPPGRVDQAAERLANPGRPGKKGLSLLVDVLLAGLELPRHAPSQVRDALGRVGIHVGGLILDGLRLKIENCQNWGRCFFILLSDYRSVSRL